MKNYLTLLLITLFTSTLSSQAQIAVKSFHKLDNDMTAKIKAPKMMLMEMFVLLSKLALLKMGSVGILELWILFLPNIIPENVGSMFHKGLND